MNGQTLDWVSRSGPSLGEIGSTINADGNANVYGSASFQGSIDFYLGHGTTTLTSAGGTDGIGEFRFDENDDFYLVGKFENTVEVDVGTGVTNLVSSGSGDVMILKYTAAASLI